MAATIVEPKPGVDMGRVVVSVKVENYEDRMRAGRGEIDATAIRSIEIDALVDSGATFFCLPEPYVSQLGLEFVRTRESRTVTGPLALNVFGVATIEVQGRQCNVEVLCLPPGGPCLLGQIPLETMDWWVDLKGHRLVGNPEHGGQWMAEVY